MPAKLTQDQCFGAATITHLIGAGGMGVVWGGVHEPSGHPVVIKTIAPRLLSQPRLISAFRGEVEAVARLDHPGIVTIYDYGQTAASCAPLDHPIEVGTPYMVMELLAGASLNHASALRWHTLRDILAQLLDALAYAHARDVIHRDLKPPNIMFDPLTGRTRLIDFGIASIIANSQQRVEGGTLAYMAPEQLFAGAQDPLNHHIEGPWTDLYALGCTAWELATGRTPLQISSPQDALAALRSPSHLALQEPPHASPGFASWVERLIAVEPADRFQRAADALRALLALPDPPTTDAPLATISHAYAPLSTLSCLERLDDSSALHRLVTRPAQLASHAVPDDWRAAPPHNKSAPRAEDAPRLSGVGLGLYGLRSSGLTGREAERDLLWASLRAVTADHAPSLIALDGPAGVGKSSLARWLCERAHELGAATPLTASHDARSDGVVAALRRELGCADLLGDLLRTRLSLRLKAQGVVDPAEIAALADTLSPRSAEDARPDAPALVKYGPIARAIARLAHQRPVIMWCELGQHIETSPLLEFLIPWLRAHKARVLTIVTTRNAAPAPLEAWLDAHAQRLHIAPLAPDLHRALVERLLGLTGELAEQVAARTDGNPLFATQLIGDWVTRGILIPSQRGFATAPGADTTLPASIDQVLIERIDDALKSGPPASQADARRALELACALGRRVQQAEWEEACALEDLDAPAWLLDRLSARGLTTRRPDGFSFTHGMMVESVELRMRADQRWQTANLTITRALEQRSSAPNVEATERLCAHMIEAEQLDRALDLLQQLTSRGSPERCAALLAAMHKLPASLAPLQHARLGFVSGAAAMAAGELEDAQRLLLEAHDRFTALDHQRLLTLTRTRLAWLRFYDGAYESALATAEEALPQLEALHDDTPEDEELRINLHRLLGNIHCFARRPQRALLILQRAISLADALQSSWNSAWARYEAAMACMDLGQDHYKISHQYLDEAQALMELLGEQIGVASCYLLRGSLRTHNLELAPDAPGWREGLAAFERALDILERLEDPGRLIARENLGRAALALGQYARAREHLEVVALAAAAHHGIFAGFVHDALLLACLATDDHVGCERALTAAEARDPAQEPAELFNVQTFARAAQLARERGIAALAERIAALALSAQRELNDPAEVTP
jgi:serine/threonine protein kinase/tetratricopeptide (TPR) repeat protein